MMLVCAQSVVRRKFNNGFTLIELMFTIVLMAIMISMVLPLGQVAEGFKLDYLNQRIYSSAILARSEAIKRSETVSLCRSTSGTACNEGANWADGWIIFVNPDENNVIDAGEEVIQVYNPISSPVNITWSNGQLLTFVSRGSPVAQGSFTLCSVLFSPLSQRQVNVSGAGLIRKQDGESCP